jgi:hypothetical protein
MSEKFEKLEGFVGYEGYVGDDAFKELTSLLEKEEVIYEESPIGINVDFVETTYDIDGKHYMLWYQVKTPRTLEGRKYNFGFLQVES